MRIILLVSAILMLVSDWGNAANARDPFQPLVTRWSGRKDIPMLQQYEISQLKFAGVIWGTENPRVLFEDPAGEAHIVTKKSKIGKNLAVITKIDKTHVVIREDIKKPDGTIQSHFTTMYLKK